MRLRLALVALFTALAPLSPTPAAGAEQVAPLAAAAAFPRFAALAGDWVDADGGFGMKGQVAVTYRLTGAGSAVVETLFAGTPHEMTTVYHRDGDDLVLTHYCAAGNQPRMRARTVVGDLVAFDFDGGTNLDPSRDSHMHAARFELLSADEIRGQWIGWAGGKPSDHLVQFHLVRKKE